jgi:hypothetical protein
VPAQAGSGQLHKLTSCKEGKLGSGRGRCTATCVFLNNIEAMAHKQTVLNSSVQYQGSLPCASQACEALQRWWVHHQAANTDGVIETHCVANTSSAQTGYPSCTGTGLRGKRVTLCVCTSCITIGMCKVTPMRSAAVCKGMLGLQRCTVAWYLRW